MILEGTNVEARVYPAQAVAGEFGAVELQPGDPAGEGTTVYGSLTRPAAPVNSVGGFDPDAGLTFRCRAFPWPARSVVEIDGELWDVVSTPRTNGRSLIHRHVQVELAARGPGLPAAPTGLTPEVF